MAEKQGIELFTAATPNGKKISIMLEELGIPYTVRALEFSKQEQKEAWFLKINPNGRIPAIIDHDNDHFNVFESGAILIYLAEKHGKFLPHDVKRRSEVIQWLMWQMGGIGPMQGELANQKHLPSLTGQAGVFFRYAPEKIPYAIDRYQKETRRLYEVLESRLQGREYVCDEVSIADFALYPWVSMHDWVGVSVEGLPHVQSWLKTMSERPAVQRGMDVPHTEQRKAEDIVKVAQTMLVNAKV